MRFNLGWMIGESVRDRLPVFYKTNDLSGVSVKLSLKEVKQLLS